LIVAARWQEAAESAESAESTESTETAKSTNRPALTFHTSFFGKTVKEESLVSLICGFDFHRLITAPSL